MNPKRPSQARPRLLPPEYLKLPDGRHIRTQDLTHRVTHRQNHNLRTGLVRGSRSSQAKYSAADLTWCAQATIPEIQARWNLATATALALRTRARHNPTYLARQRAADLAQGPESDTQE